jgi:hypothetical protein
VLCLVVVVAFQLIVSPAWSQPLVDRVPDDAIVYVGWRGAGSAVPGYEQSHLKALLASSNIPAVFNDLVPRLLAKAAKEGGTEAAQVVDAFNMLAKPMWKYPTAMYLAMNVDGPEPMPRAALMCQAGADAAAIQKKIDDLLAQADRPPVPVKTFLVNGDWKMAQWRWQAMGARRWARRWHSAMPSQRTAEANRSASSTSMAKTSSASSTPWCRKATWTS